MALGYLEGLPGWGVQPPGTEVGRWVTLGGEILEGGRDLSVLSNRQLSEAAGRKKPQFGCKKMIASAKPIGNPTSIAEGLRNLQQTQPGLSWSCLGAVQLWQLLLPPGSWGGDRASPQSPTHSQICAHLPLPNAARGARLLECFQRSLLFVSY